MNRKKITSRHRGKQLDRKKARAAERQVLHGGHYRTIRSDRWNLRMAQPPLLDTERVGGVKKKNKKTPQGCPSRPGKKRHEYLRDTIRSVSPWWLGRQYKYERVFKLCVHCGLEKTVKYKRIDT